MCVWYYGAFDKAPYIYYTIEVLLLLLLCVRTLCSIYFFTVYNMDEFAQQIRLLAEWQDRNFNDEEEGKKISEHYGTEATTHVVSFGWAGDLQIFYGKVDVISWTPRYYDVYFSIENLQVPHPPKTNHVCCGFCAVGLFFHFIFVTQIFGIVESWKNPTPRNFFVKFSV